MVGNNYFNKIFNDYLNKAYLRVYADLQIY